VFSLNLLLLKSILKGFDILLESIRLFRVVLSEVVLRSPKADMAADFGVLLILRSGYMAHLWLLLMVLNRYSAYILLLKFVDHRR